jgi:ribosomal protein L7Ae-like RNA K-turn-binding protein
VVIAHDVDPIELVVWLPALCRKMEVPCAIVKGKFFLGVFIFSSVWFLLKKVTKPNFLKKKTKPKPVQTDRFRFGSVF